MVRRYAGWLVCECLEWLGELERGSAPPIRRVWKGHMTDPLLSREWSDVVPSPLPCSPPLARLCRHGKYGVQYDVSISRFARMGIWILQPPFSSPTPACILLITSHQIKSTSLSSFCGLSFVGFSLPARRWVFGLRGPAFSVCVCVCCTWFLALRGGTPVR